MTSQELHLELERVLTPRNATKLADEWSEDAEMIFSIPYRKVSAVTKCFHANRDLDTNERRICDTI